MPALVAELTGADPNLVGTITIEVRRAADDVVVTPATTAGIVEVDVGVYDYTAELPVGSYVVHWDDGAGGTAEEGIDVVDASSAPPVVIPPGLVYAAPADLRVRLGLASDDTATLSDDAAAALLRNAEDRVDRIAGTWPIRPDNGRKFNLAGLTALYAAAVRNATTVLAAAEHRNPNAFTLNAVDGKTGMVRGPDFELRSPTPLPPEGRAAFRDAAALLDNMGLRTLTARMRP